MTLNDLFDDYEVHSCKYLVKDISDYHDRTYCITNGIIPIHFSNRLQRKTTKRHIRVQDEVDWFTSRMCQHGSRSSY